MKTQPRSQGLFPALGTRLMETVLKSSRPNRAFFFSLETISIGDDIKIKRKFSPFFSSTLISSFYCCPFSISCPFTWLGGGLKEFRNQGEKWVIGIKFFNTVFINPDIYSCEKGCLAFGEKLTCQCRKLLWVMVVLTVAWVILGVFHRGERKQHNTSIRLLPIIPIGIVA